MNRVALTGRVTKDIESRMSQSGKEVARFTMAVNRRKKEDGADFISCVAFGKTAEVMAKYVKKGTQIGITGRIQTGSYDKDGKNVYTTDVIVDEMEFLESKKEIQTEPASAPEMMDIPDNITDDLPF